MPQSSTTTSLRIAGGYKNTSFSLGDLVGELTAGNSAAGQTVSMSQLRYTLSGTQQGSKLVGSGYVGTQIRQGYSTSLSADGNTLAIGGLNDNNGIGAVWIFTRSGTTWSQQGSKLVGTGYNVGGAQQGGSVSLSADGNTLAVGGQYDVFGIGAVWIFTRSGTTWSQQGSKLVGTGNVGNSYQGRVSLSADGNTLAVGGAGDDNQKGAVWIFTRSGTTWSQQGSKLVGTGTTLFYNSQGCSVSLSADGNTLAVGGYGDNNQKGAVWIFTRSGTTWSQQGSKLVGTGDAGGYSSQGISVALSADGNTLALGGYYDGTTDTTGAVWIFTRSGTTWSQQGSKLVGTGYTGGFILQGASISLSADGNILVVGGYQDNDGVGAVWIFTRSESTWTQQGTKLVGTGNVGNAQQGVSVSLSSNGNTLVIAGEYDNNRIGAAWVFV